MDGRDFATLDVRLVRSTDGYLAVADSSYGGTYRGRFDSPVAADDLRHFQAALVAGATRDLGPPDDEPVAEHGAAPALADRIGAALFEALFAGELLEGLRETFTLSQRDGRMVRIRLRLDTVPELGSLPWELMRDEQRDRYLCLSSRTQVVRHLGIPEPVRDLELRGPLRVLVVVASPSDLPPLAVEDEWTALVDELESVGAAGTVELRRVVPPTLDELSRQLLAGPWHVFHFIGHGQANPPSLAFCGNDGRTALVSAEVLAVTLADSVDLRLAMLNACHSARASERDAFGGVAHELLHHSIPAAVAMQFAISDPAAIAFAARFYGAMSHGLPVDRAVGDARKALYQRGAEWATPVVHLRGDGVVFEHASPPPTVPPTARPARRSRRRPILIAAAAGVLAALGAIWWLTDRSEDGDATTSETSVSTTRSIALPAGLELEPTTTVTRICRSGGRIDVSAGPAQLVGDIIAIPFGAVAHALQTETHFDAILVVDDQSRAYGETDAGALTGGFRLLQDDAPEETQVADEVSVNRDERLHAGAQGIVLVVTGECDDEPILLPVAMPAG
jgi:hypothetical protein